MTINPHHTHTFCCVMADVLHLALHPMFLSQAKPSWLQAYGSSGQMLQLSPSPEPIVLQMHNTLATEPITVTKYTPTGPVGPHFRFLQKVRRPGYQGESCLQAKAWASFAWFCCTFQNVLCSMPLRLKCAKCFHRLPLQNLTVYRGLWPSGPSGSRLLADVLAASAAVTPHADGNSGVKTLSVGPAGRKVTMLMKSLAAEALPANSCHHISKRTRFRHQAQHHVSVMHVDTAHYQHRMVQRLPTSQERDVELARGHTSYLLLRPYGLGERYILALHAFDVSHWAVGPPTCMHALYKCGLPRQRCW